MRFYDKGRWYGVSFNETEISDFRRQWPASGLHGLRSIYFEFDKRNGDLVDLKANGKHDAGRFDGPALVALSEDAQKLAIRKLEERRHSSRQQQLLYKGKGIQKLFPSGYYEIYSDAQGRFLKFDSLSDAKAQIDSELP